MLIVTHSNNEVPPQRVSVMAEEPGRIVGAAVDLPEERV